MEIIIPREAMVVICGPSCAGKTTLARRIMQEISQTSKYRYSLDEETVIAMRKIPELQACAEYLARGGVYREGDHSREANAQFSLKKSEQLANALENYQLVVYDGILLSRNGARQQLSAMSLVRSTFGHQRDPLVLIKMLPEERLHCDFCLERQQKRDNACLPPKYVLAQRLQFAMEIARYDFAEVLPIQRECYEYTVTDPRTVELVAR